MPPANNASRNIYIGVLIFICTAVFFFLQNSISRNPAMKCNNCNVIFIVIDTLRADELPCYGYPRNTAPNLCRLIDRSISYTNSYSQASWTLPSNISYFTSQFPFQHHVLFAGQDTLSASIHTMPEVFSDASFQTIYSGPDHPNSPIDKGMGRGFFQILPYANIENWSYAIEQLIASNKKRTPGFVYLHSYELTSSWAEYVSPENTSSFVKPTPDTQRLFEIASWYFTQIYDKKTLPIDAAIDQFLSSESTSEILENFKKLPQNMQNDIYAYTLHDAINPHNPEHIRFIRSLYDKKLQNLDAQLSKILTMLEKSDILKQTIIVFTSDHGEEFGEHGGTGHGVNLYNPVTRVPLSIYIPGVKPQIREDLAQGVDIFPTLLAAVGISAPQTLYGINLFTNKNMFLTLETKPGPDTIISAIRTNGWSYYKKIEKNHTTEELFDLQQDPSEVNNQVKSHPHTTEFLRKTLQTLQSNQYNQRLITPVSQALD